MAGPPGCWRRRTRAGAGPAQRLSRGRPGPFRHFPAGVPRHRHPGGRWCEIRSTARLFEGLRDVPIGSIKSNLGRPHQAAGIAGLLKLLGAMEHRIRPASLHVVGAAESIGDLAGSPFRLLTRNEPWEVPEGRRAVVSAFGFGGDDAHLIVGGISTRCGTTGNACPTTGKSGGGGDERFGRRCRRSGGDSPQAVFRSAPRPPRVDSVALELAGIGFAPLDLASALPRQQVLALQVASEALECAGALPPARTGVFVGMGCDAEVARYGLRWRRAAAGDRAADGDAICPPDGPRRARPAGQHYRQPHQRRVRPARAQLCGDGGGTVRRDRPTSWRRGRWPRGELDAAVVGAVDLSCEPVHETAARSVLPGRPAAAHAAVFLVLKRLEDAGKGALATIEAAAERSPELDGRRHAGIRPRSRRFPDCSTPLPEFWPARMGRRRRPRPGSRAKGAGGAVRVPPAGDASGMGRLCRRSRHPYPAGAPRSAWALVIYSGADRAEKF